MFGSNTGIPVSDLTVVNPPLPPLVDQPAVPGRVEAGSAWTQGENDFNVLQRGNRLQITADVDLEGLATLKDMLRGVTNRFAAARRAKVEIGYSHW